MTNYSISLSGSCDEQIQALAEQENTTPQNIMRSILWYYFDRGLYEEHFQKLNEDVDEIQIRRRLSSIRARGTRAKRAATLNHRVQEQMTRYRNTGLSAEEIREVMASYVAEAAVYGDDLADRIKTTIDHYVARYTVDDRYNKKMQGKPMHSWPDREKDRYWEEIDVIDRRYAE